MMSHVNLPQLPAILDSIDEGILVVDENNKITHFNPQFTKMWGIPFSVMQERNDEKTLNYVFKQLLDPAAFIKKVQDLYNSDVEDRDLIRFKDGRVFERHSLPLKTSEKKYSKLSRIWSFLDVTEKINTDLELKLYKSQLAKLVALRTKELEQANIRLEAFNYSASHDLRAPLRSITGFSAILLEDYHSQLDAQGQKYLRTIQNSVNHMQQIIDNLLNLSQVSHNKLTCQKIDMSLVVKKIVARLSSEMPERLFKMDITAGMFVYADSVLLNIALENLIENAWKFSASQHETLIKVGCFIEDGETVYFIKDNGIGFNMNAAGELFTPFKRLHSSADFFNSNSNSNSNCNDSDTEFPGTGIGLATVQRIIKRHNGKIWAEAEPNNGATFYFTLSVPHNHRFVTH